jgi:hypothetical protein
MKEEYGLMMGRGVHTPGTRTLKPEAITICYMQYALNFLKIM